MSANTDRQKAAIFEKNIRHYHGEKVMAWIENFSV